MLPLKAAVLKYSSHLIQLLKQAAAFNQSNTRDDYKFSEVIGQKPLIATLVPILIGHPYIALERQCISGRTLSKMV